MRKLKIGYWPISQKLDAPGDRRRLIFWANARGHEVITDLGRSVDIVVASENSDFNSDYFTSKGVPLVFDLIDSYLSPLNALDDFARGLAKKISGQISGEVKSFSQHIKDFCAISDAVICSSVEQESVIKNYQKKTHIILDSHEEIPILEPHYFKTDAPHLRNILWEGQPATISGVNQISSVLHSLIRDYGIEINFVTDLKYFRLLNKFIESDTRRLLESDLYISSQRIHLTDWSVGNLIRRAEQSALAMIPINLAIPMQRLKPENRLLIMWRLGLPCLTSPSAAYARVAQDAEAKVICNTLEEWQENFEQLLKDPVFAKNQIARGQNYIHEHHSQRILLKKWDEAIESVL
jgi:hypothetical protein